MGAGRILESEINDAMTIGSEAEDDWRRAAEGAPRIASIAAGSSAIELLIHRLGEISCAGLPKMYRRGRHTVAHTLRRDSTGHETLHGESLRYAAITLLGVRWLDESAQRRILGELTASQFSARLVATAMDHQNVGDIALIAWGAAELEISHTEELLALVCELAASEPDGYTVQHAWVLSALAAALPKLDVAEQADQACRRLLDTFSLDTGVFRHTLGPLRRSSPRAHIACFADMVYPIQALARYHRAVGDEAALTAANRGATQICRLQGPGGQWWWHYDARTGRVVEGYPVYSVHQDAMGPMCLLDLAEAGGDDHSDAIRYGLGWMDEATEVGHSLIDETCPTIWRKVGRADPNKLVRSVRAVASWLHPELRMSWLDSPFPPTQVEYESRPYHLAWVLDTWLSRR